MAAVHLPHRLASMVGMTIAFRLPHQTFSALGRPISALTSLITLQSRPPHRVSVNPSLRTYAVANDPDDSTATAIGRKKVVFLGTPDVAALVLGKLLTASKLPDSTFDITAVVSQPGRPKGRSRQTQPSPVENLALDSGLSPEQILCPERATDPAFLATLSSLAPDLCITAAYGNYLPTKFLAIPQFGTLNIHPSLLPAYRGAAPVQRSLQDGLSITGVTVLYTVKEMDAGPILAQQKLPIDSDIQSPELLNKLFELGTELILDNLEVVWAGMGPKIAQPQNDSAATHAAKITRDEGALNFSESASTCHNKVRGFAGWPGTYHTFALVDVEGIRELMELKILKTKVREDLCGPPGQGVDIGKDSLKITCGDGKVLEVLEVQAPGRKVVAAKNFINGLKGRCMMWTKEVDMIKN